MQKPKSYFISLQGEAKSGNFIFQLVMSGSNFSKYEIVRKAVCELVEERIMRGK